MGLFGSMAGGALGAVGSIFGGISASKAMKNVRRNLQQRKQQNQNWFDRRYNEDATQRADAQRILAKTEETVRNRNRQAAGTQAVMGGTDESLAAERAANAQSVAEAASRIAVNADSRKEAMEQSYRAEDSRLDGALNDMEINKAKAIADAVRGVGQAGAGMAGAF